MRTRTKEIIIVCVLIGIAFVRFLFFVPKAPVGYESAVGKKVSVVGMVNDYPDRREENVHYSLQPNGQDFNLLIISYEEKGFKYGDILKVEGRLEKPENFETNVGKEFDYKRYLFSKDTFYIIRNAKLEKLGENGNVLKKGLFWFRTKFEASLDRVLSYRDAGFAKGLLIGEKGGISDKDKNDFVKTGTVHVVALSGYNVMVVANFVIGIFSYLFASGVGYFLGGMSLVLFVIMAGAGATAIRAGLMAIIALYGRHTGREYDALRALIIVSLLMLVWNPRVILDVSFHLSVLATFGVIMFPSKLIKYFYFLPVWKKFNLRADASATAGAIIMVTPYIAYVMGTVSLISFIANIFVLAFIPYTMFFGFLAGTFGFVSYTFSIPFSFITTILDKYIFGVVHFFASIPFASINIQQFPLLATLALYIFLFWYVFQKNK